MSTPASGSPTTQHAPEEAVRWFNQWHVYRSIVDANWMAHREILTAIRTWVMQRYPGPFTLVDLGCGDAGCIRGTFDETGLWAYTGVDASQTALAKARDELVGARFAVRLLEADMLAYLREHPEPAARSCDVILASYAVHHLPAPEKREFFRLAHAKLAPRGSLLFADVFRRDGETREQYFECYVGMMRTAWTGMSPEHLAGTIDHVRQRDFPETGEAICDMAREAGFEAGFEAVPALKSQELFRDETGFHRLMAFTKGAGA